MADKMTDAEIVARLQVIEKHEGNMTKAAIELGMAGSSLRQLKATAKARGLTAASKVLDEEGKLRTQLKLAQQKVKELEKENDTAEAIREAVFKLSGHTPEPPAWIMREGKGGHRGCPITMWSDFHWGEVVNRDEVGGVNEYNTDIARTRAKRLVDVTCDLAFHHMGRARVQYPGIVICLGGDMISGDIHEELSISNQITSMQTVNELTDQLAGSLDMMATKFGKVFVPCVVGNHGRSTKKMRMKGRVYTSFDWLVYCNLERFFKKDKHIQFMIPPEADAHFKVYGHRYMLTHGDSLGVKGGDGIIGSLGPIMRGAIKVGRSEAHIGRDFDTLLMGHWHQYLTLPGVIVNGALKGYDEYARLALRVPYTRPSQALWFSHPEHGITAHWQVYLEGQQQATDNSDWVSWSQARKEG